MQGGWRCWGRSNLIFIQDLRGKQRLPDARLRPALGHLDAVRLGGRQEVLLVHRVFVTVVDVDVCDRGATVAVRDERVVLQAVDADVFRAVVPYIRPSSSPAWRRRPAVRPSTAIVTQRQASHFGGIRPVGIAPPAGAKAQSSGTNQPRGGGGETAARRDRSAQRAAAARGEPRRLYVQSRTRLGAGDSGAGRRDGG